MNLQQQLNEMSVASLPRVHKLINEAGVCEANQMFHKALRMMSDAWKPVSKMSMAELDEFQDDMIAIFEYREWI